MRFPIEPLEPRIAPATLLGDKMTVTFQDIDGDNVIVKFSKPLLDSQAVADSVFKFSSGGVDGSNVTGQQLWLIDLTALPIPAAAKGVNVTVMAKRDGAHGGDGAAAVGNINGTNLDLGAVSIAGDLGRITAGDADLATPGLKLLKAHSMGHMGLETQDPAAANLFSVVIGSLNVLKLRGDLDGATLAINGPDTKLGAGTIGGSLIGREGASTGHITATNIDKLTIKGSILGGGGSRAGSIYIFGGMLKSLTVHGSLVGGADDNSGEIFGANGGQLDKIKILGNVIGSGAAGKISSSSNIGSVFVGGSVSGRILSTDDGAQIGKITVGGDVTGRIGSRGTYAGVTVGGSLSGLISVIDNAGFVKIGGSVIGGSIYSNNGSFGPITIGGSLIGDATDESGFIFAHQNIGLVRIGGDLVGGSNAGTATLYSGAIIGRQIAGIAIGGSIVAGFDDGSGLGYNARIGAENSLGPVVVKGSILGNETTRAIIAAVGSATPSEAAGTDVAIARLTVGGSVQFADILAGYNSGEAPLNADAQIGSVKIGGDWTASNLVAGVEAGSGKNFGTAGDHLIAGGTNTPIVSKIASVLIKGLATGTGGGTDHFGFVAEQIGSFSVNGTAFPLAPGPRNDTSAFTSLLNVGPTMDLRVLEVSS